MGLTRDILIFLGILAVIILALGAVGGLIMLATKALGVILILLGAFLIIWFPDIPKYQPVGMSKAGVFVGIIILITGLAMVLV